MELAKFNLEDAIQQQFIIGAIKKFMPDVAKFYPAVESILANIQKDFADYIGEGEKICFCMRRNGQTRVIVIDATKPFSFDGTGFSGSKDAILVNQEVNQFVNEKIFGNPMFKWMKDDYERNFKGTEEGDNALKLMQGGE